MSDLQLKSVEPWAPHSTAAPLTERSDDTLAIAANGTRTCIGGWQITYSGVEAGKVYEMVADAQFQDVDLVRDVLRCEAYWGQQDDSSKGKNQVVLWDYLLPEWDGDTVRFKRRLKAPQDTAELMIRYTFRWSVTGSSEWQLPDLSVTEVADVSEPVKICVVTGRREDRNRRFESIQENVDLYAPLCRDACEKEKPDLVVLPEIALQYGIKGSPLELAVPVPSPETEPFADIAREYGVHLMLGVIERDGDAVHNTAVLFAPDGGVDGKYRKVHLAEGNEINSGILPGDDFPVFDTAIGRIGCNICMDSSAAESSRMIGLNGADFLLLPIMGDHRAWHPEDHTWDPERFRGIMQTRALDNQLCMVVAVNRAEGSCIIDRTRHVLAWNDGDEPFVTAEVNLVDGFRPNSGGCYRGINWMQLRPHTYGVSVDEKNVGGLLVEEY